MCLGKKREQFISPARWRMPDSHRSNSGQSTPCLPGFKSNGTVQRGLSVCAWHWGVYVAALFSAGGKPLSSSITISWLSASFSDTSADFTNVSSSCKRRVRLLNITKIYSRVLSLWSRTFDYLLHEKWLKHSQKQTNLKNLKRIWLTWGTKGVKGLLMYLLNLFL